MIERVQGSNDHTYWFIGALTQRKLRESVFITSAVRIMAQKYLHNFKRGACVTGNMKREAVKLMEERRWQGTCMIERIATLWNRDIIITLQRKTLETQTTVFTIFYVPSYRALVMYRTPRISVSEDLYEIN